MSYDLLIRSGRVVDGTGNPSFHADIGVTDGRIVDIGPALPGSARQTIDASDLVVSPGFVDPHTHYDAQICWDTAMTPSVWHGVTSVVMGNCGVGVAPCRPAMRDIVVHDLVNVEGIPVDVLEQGIRWEWETFPEYMAAAARHPTSINLGFLAPLTPLRHFVMGEASMERAANEAEIAALKAVIKEAVSAGALGFSTSNLLQHIGYQGRPLACRNASLDELKAGAEALRELGKGIVEIALCRDTSVLSDDEYAMLDMLLTASGRPVSWISLLHRDDKPDACRDSLKKAAPLIARGANPQSSSLPLTRELRMNNPFIFAAFPSWKPAFNKAKPELVALFNSADFRNAFREDLKRITTRRWDRFVVSAPHTSALKKYETMTVADIAREWGKDGVDTFLDFLLADELETELTVATLNVTEDRVPEILTNPGVLIGLGDAGAHVAQTCDAGYCTYLLGKWVREKGIMSLEHAIHRLTAQPASIFGIKDRGRIQKGLAADFAIFDPTTVGSASRGVKRNDLPGNGTRYVIEARGIHTTVVNGTVAWADGAVTDARAGRVLKS